MARGRRQGFTLIETVAAIVILAVAVPPMLWAVSEAHLKRANPRLASQARWLAVEKLEDIIADRHSTDARGWTWVTDPSKYPAETPVTGFDNFNRSVTLTPRGPWDNTVPGWTAGPPTNYLEVTVAVDWTDANGVANTLSIATILTFYDPQQ